MDTINSYSYLRATLLATAILSAVAYNLRNQRKIAFFSGFLHAPSGIFAFTFVEYWTPERLGGRAVGIEDILFNYASGISVWLLVAPWPFAQKLRVDWNFKVIMRRVALFATSVPLVYFFLWRLGMNPMTALMSTFALCGCFVLLRRPHIWLLAVPAAISYPVLHGFATAFAFEFWPDLPTTWNSDNLWGMPILFGAPLGELAWAAVYGSSWPLIVAFLLDAQPRCTDQDTKRALTHI
jgi:hypothetical protein